jgi:hypothetical protein
MSLLHAATCAWLGLTLSTPVHAGGLAPESTTTLWPEGVGGQESGSLK